MRQTCLNTVGPELAELQAAARPIPPCDRSEFLRDVAVKLSRIIPSLVLGIIGRVTAKLQRAHLNMPRRGNYVGSKWAELIFNFPTMGKLEWVAPCGRCPREALAFLAIVAIMVALAVC